ncbi:IS1634 family transposase, partial [Halorhodospira halochloris]|nr:IS1634 family transposase [Halorhodospira halochloris]
DRGLLSLDNVDTLDALAEQEGLSVDYILAVPGRRYAEFTDLMAELHPQLEEQAAAKQQGQEGEAVTETLWQGRRLIVAHNAQRAAEQRASRRHKIQRLDQLGEALARRLDNQDAGKPG